jgi:hypothetical protein
VIVAGDGLGDEYDVAREISYDLAVEARCLVFSRPQVRYSAPGPARCQEAVYQDCLAAGGGPGLLGCGAELRSSLLDKRRDIGNDAGDSRLRSVEDLGPDFLDDILPRISRRHDYGFSQGKFLWPAGCRCPTDSRGARRHGPLVRRVAQSRVLTYDRIATASPSVKGLADTSFLLMGEAVVCQARRIRMVLYDNNS